MDEAKPLWEKEVSNLVYDVVSGMEYIYSKGVEHCDLKETMFLDDHTGAGSKSM